MSGEKHEILDIETFKSKLGRYSTQSLMPLVPKKAIIAQNPNQHDVLIATYTDLISEVERQIAELKGEWTTTAQQFDVYYECQLKDRIEGLIRHRRALIQEWNSQITFNQTLKHLLTLSPHELIEAAQNNKTQALIIINTSNFFNKLTDEQLEQLVVKDSEIAKALAQSLAARPYNATVVKVYGLLKQQVETDADKAFITEQENKVIQVLLNTVKAHLDGQIEKALQDKKLPWSLGYFGSKHKIYKDNMRVAVPQGIYELKGHLDQLDKLPPRQILDNIQTMIHAKQADIQNGSFLHRIMHFISYLFGYHRKQDTIAEYNRLEQQFSGVPAA